MNAENAELERQKREKTEKEKSNVEPEVVEKSKDMEASTITDVTDKFNNLTPAIQQQMLGAEEKSCSELIESEATETLNELVQSELCSDENNDKLKKVECIEVSNDKKEEEKMNITINSVENECMPKPLQNELESAFSPEVVHKVENNECKNNLNLVPNRRSRRHTSESKVYVLNEEEKSNAISPKKGKKLIKQKKKKGKDIDLSPTGKNIPSSQEKDASKTSDSDDKIGKASSKKNNLRNKFKVVGNKTPEKSTTKKLKKGEINSGSTKEGGKTLDAPKMENNVNSLEKKKPNTKDDIGRSSQKQLIKGRKKCLSFSEDKNDKQTNLTEKKRCLSVDSKDSVNSKVLPNITPKKNKPKKKIIKNESLGIYPHEPSLFSQPDVMVKVKTDDSSDKKDEKDKSPTKELKGDHLPKESVPVEIASQLGKIEEEVNEVDLIKAEVELEQSKLKLSPEKTSINILVSRETKNAKTETKAADDSVMVHVKSESNKGVNDKKIVAVNNEEKTNRNSAKRNLTNSIKSPTHVNMIAGHSEELSNPKSALTSFDQKLMEALNNDRSGSKNISASTFISNDAAVKTEFETMPTPSLISGTVGVSSSESSETIADIEQAVKQKPSHSNEIKSVTEHGYSLNVVNASSSKPKNGVNKNVDTPKPERKSPRNIQKKRRIYEDDSPERIVQAKKVQQPLKNKKNTTTTKKNNKKPSEKVNDEESEEEAKMRIEYSDDSDDSDWSSEDDPEKLWCICRKPHNNKFMIQCDKCEDWFHGSCVGISRQQGCQLEKLKKEWKCPNCIKATPIKEVTTNASLMLNNLPGKKITLNEAKAVKKDEITTVAKENNARTMSTRDLLHTANTDKTKSIETGTNAHEKGRGLKNERSTGKEVKSEIVRERILIKNDICKEKVMSRQHANKEKVLLKRETSKERIVAKNDSNKDRILLKNEMSKEKLSPKAEPNKVGITHAPSKDKNEIGKEKCIVVDKTVLQKGILVIRKDKNKKMFIERQHITNSSIVKKVVIKSNRIESLQPEKSSPEPCNIQKKKPLPSPKDNKPTKESARNKNECISCLKPAPVGTVYCSQACLEEYAAESIKILQDNKGSTKATEDLNSKKVVVFDRQTNNLIAGVNAPVVSEVVSWLKSNPSFEIVRPTPPKKDQTQKQEVKPQQTLDRRDDAEESAKESVRLNVRKTLKNILEERCKNADDLQMVEADIKKIAVQIEEELHKYQKDTSSKYRSKYRSLMFNIKDPRNQGLFRKILKGKIPPDQLVRMSTEELASSDLAKWREMENQHSLDMIKRMQIEQQQSAGLLLKKTHKGEVEIEDEVVSVLEQDVTKAPDKVVEETPEVEKVEKEKKEKEKKETPETQKDTTALHRSHLFDLNCKICTGKVAPPPMEEVAPKKVRVAHSISIEQSSPRVVDPVEKLVSRVVEGPSPPVVQTTEDSVDHEPSSTTHSSPDTSTVQRKLISKSSKTQSSVWKGFIFMLDVAKFVTSAYKVSGPTDFLHQDIPDTIQVCGRIIPDQVWEYLSKIKQSGNKELIIIRFQAANEEETAAYNAFYVYLSSRKRYGVVNGYSKMIKDFYIMPLTAHTPVPTVLMPFDGPGLPSHRPHLLLGVLVRHKSKLQSSAVQPTTQEESESCEGSYTPPLENRSYTPPLPVVASPDQIKVSSSVPAYNPTRDISILQVQPSSSTPPYVPYGSGNILKRAAEDDEPYEPSYTPPLEKMPKMDISISAKDDDADKPYDPEQVVLNIRSSGLQLESNLSETHQAKNTINELMKKLTDNSSAAHLPVTTMTSSSDLERQKKLLNELTRKVEETDRQVNQSINVLKQLGAISPEIPDRFDAEATVGNEIDNISGISTSGMSSFLNLPENLQEILNSVRQKSFDNDKIQEAAKDVDIRYIPESKSDVDIRYFPQGAQDIDIRQLPHYSPNNRDAEMPGISATDIDDRSCSPDATPPPVEEENSSSVLRPSDPRIKIRTSFQEVAYNEEPQKVSLSTMSTSELVERAQKELEEMEAIQNAQNAQQVENASNSSGAKFLELHSKNWDQYQEPPPPGIEPVELPSTETIAFSNKTVVSESPSAVSSQSFTPSYSPLSAMSENHVLAPPFAPPPLPAGFRSLPPAFAVPTPSTPVDLLKSFPPPPLPLPGFLPQTAPEGAESHPMRDEPWPPWADGHPGDMDWRDRPPHWDEHDWGDWDHRQPYERDRGPSDYFFDRESGYWHQDSSTEYQREEYERYERDRLRWADRDWDERFDRPPPEELEGRYRRYRRGNRRDEHWRGRKRHFSRGKDRRE